MFIFWMDPLEDLSDWVAVKADIFSQDDSTESPRFICAWNEEASKVAITLHERSRKASDQNSENRVCLLSLREIYHIHNQLCLINSSLSKYFPKEIQPNIKPLKKNYDFVSSSVEYYLSNAVQAVGKKLVIATLFGDDDPLGCYEENWNDLRLATLESSVDKGYEELQEVMNLRQKAESLLQMMTIYALEDQVIKNIFDCLSELYNFHLQPFLELREMSYVRVKQAKTKLCEEIGPKIKQKAERDFTEWSEQSLVATEALQQLYQEFYRKTLNLALGQRDRMILDKKRFGRAAFELHGMPRLLKLEVQVCQEDLKLQNAIKATKEYQRDKIKNQLTYLSYDFSAVREIERIAEEITNAQISVYDARLDVLEAEERLHKSQLAIINKEDRDSLETGIFFDAVENLEELKDINSDSPEPNPKVYKLKQKLYKIYQKRAQIRTKKKTILTEIKKKKSEKAALIEKNEKAASLARKRQGFKSKELPKDKLAYERRKTLQRLKEYKKKASFLEIKDQESEGDVKDAESCDSQEDLVHKTPFKKKPVKEHKHSETKENKSNTVKVQKDSVSLPSLDSASPEMVSKISVLPPPPPPSKTTESSSTVSAFKTSLVELEPKVPSNSEITQDAVANQLKSLKKQQVQDVKKSPTSAFNLNEILMIRSKLKAPPPDADDTRMKPQQQSMDLSGILQATMKRIRNMTEDSDLESDSNSDFD